MGSLLVLEEEAVHFLKSLGIAFAIIASQVFIIWLIWKFFKHIAYKIEHASGKGKIKPLTIKHIRLLTAKQFISVIEFFMGLIKYAIIFMFVFLTLPVIFAFFPATEHLTRVIFGLFLTPLKNMAIAAVAYIPNLITIIIVVVIIRYVLKALRFFAVRIEKGKMIIPHFHADWAPPTYKILQVLLWAFALAIAYPYLPGSDSRAFHGVTVFVGILFSIGSTSAIGNLVAGLVITYMRPFKIGDLVKIKDVTGFVVEKDLMVVRLKTIKNEYVTFPNLTLLNSNIINYNTSCDEDEEGLIIYAEITFGYATAWQTVHDILINAALSTKYVQKHPKPFVHQTKLDDFYACYQINCYTKEVAKISAIYTCLYENIQDGFAKAGLDMTAAHYRAISTLDSGRRHL